MMKRDELGLQQILEVLQVIVAPHPLLPARATHALDHRGVVELIGEDQAARQELGDCRDRGFVRDEARGEDER